jgi:hypothetical protein
MMGSKREKRMKDVISAEMEKLIDEARLDQ